jgi:succinoglycan biosynthesis protein ExoA
MDESPTVSIVIPCRNEARFISGFLASILDNSYPRHLLEILIVDGMSEDATREIVREYGARYAEIKLLDNPRRVTPYALNIGIRAAKGEIIMRLDAHSVCSRDYIAQCVHVLTTYDADDVGGTWRMVPRDDTPMGRAIVKATANRVGVGNVRYRFQQPDEPQLVDTVPNFCCWRETFQTIGMFNEKLTRGQDMEFKRRLTRAGFRIVLVPGASVDYQARSDLKSFALHNWADGVWTVLAFAWSDLMPVRWRHLAPACFVAGLIGSAVLIGVSHLFVWVFAAILTVYGLAALSTGLAVSLAERDVRYAFLVPLVIVTMHVMRGAGSLWGVARLFRERRFLHAVHLAVREIRRKGSPTVTPRPWSQRN